MYIEVDGVDDTVVGYAALYVVVGSSHVLATSVSNDELEPFGIVRTEYFVSTFGEQRFTVERVDVQNRQCIALVSQRLRLAYSLFLDVGDIEAHAEVELRASESTDW